MGLIGKPSRYSVDEDRQLLIEKEAQAGGSSTLLPSALEMAEIVELPSLFQPRGDSLTMWPGNSEDHINTLAGVLRAGNDLDAVTVIAFGNEWYLVDGHHRLMSYHQVSWAKPIPVEVIDTSLSGAERVTLAETESVLRNSKNRLNMSKPEKADAAWRAVVARSDLSKSGTAKLYSVAPSTVGNMRRVKDGLLATNWELSDLQVMSWRGAAYELANRGSNSSTDGTIIDEGRRRLLAKHLAPILKMKVPAMLLLDVLEDGRAGISIELETAIQLRKEELKRADKPRLDV